jgi:hypothetical protein
MPALGATVSAFVWRAGVVWIGAALACALLTSCARDPIVTGTAMATAGNWHVEQGTDRITGTPIFSAITLTHTVSTSKIIFPPPVMMQLSCFKEAPTVVVRFPFKIGSTRNAEFGYRFDDKPGHIGNVRFVDDYKSVIIEDKDEVTRFVGELTTSHVLYVLIRALSVGRTAAEFNLDGAPTAINAAYAGCPPHRPTQPAAAAPRPRSS